LQLDHVKFVLAAEPQLRRLATQHEQFNWLSRSLDWINQQQIATPDD
jgi:hypothetical protein